MHLGERHLQRWFEGIVRASVDFLGVQFAAITSLALGGWEVASVSGPIGLSGEGLLVNFYFRTFLPLSSLFLVANACCGLYTKFRGYTLKHKIRASLDERLDVSSRVRIVGEQGARHG